MKKAPLIAFEGVDKSGKGTQSLIAAKLLKSAWGDVVHFSEPNDRDSLIGRHIRKILKGEETVPPAFELQRLYVIDRAQDTVATVLPALARGIPVVAERFALSTIAYGMLTSRTGARYVELHREVMGPWLRWPDLTVLIDISAAVAMERLAKEKGKPEHFEKLEKLTRIRDAYLHLVEHHEFAPNMDMVVVNGEQDVEGVASAVADVLKSYVP